MLHARLRGRSLRTANKQQYEACLWQRQYIRLKQVTDPSGRFIRIRYACDATDCQSCNASNWWLITDVTGSDGSSVHYTWGIGGLTRVDYNRNTPGPDSAYYTYRNTTYLMDTVCCPGGNCQNCTIIANASKLIAAWDTHADSHASIYYEYKAPGRFEEPDRNRAPAGGNLGPRRRRRRAWRSHLELCPTTPRPEIPGLPQCHAKEGIAAMDLAHNLPGTSSSACPWSSANPSFYGVNECSYHHNANNYLLTAKDRNNYTTTTNEPVLGNPTQILHRTAPHRLHLLRSQQPAYHIQTVRNEREDDRYTRDGNNRIARIDYPAVQTRLRRKKHLPTTTSARC